MKLLTKLIIVLNKSYYYRKLAYLYKRWSVNRNPMTEINRSYKLRFNKKPNVENPRNLIEKIYWMQLHCDTSLWTLCADKFRMREYVASRGCDEYLPKLYGVWNSPSEIDWSILPQQFVIKANNGCGTVLVIKDKSLYREDQVKKQMKRWLDIPYGYGGFQPHYLSIKPCIIAEELLVQDKKLDALSSSIVDFKVWCFNGKAESILVTYNRSKTHHDVDLYDIKWNRLKDCFSKQINNDNVFPKPECLDLMLSIASKLSTDHPQMRVDFYIVNDKPVIGELTMTTGYGTFTEGYYNYLGDLTDVNLMKQIK